MKFFFYFEKLTMFFHHCRHARLFATIVENSHRGADVGNENGSSCQSIPDIGISTLNARRCRVF